MRRMSIVTLVLGVGLLLPAVAMPAAAEEQQIMSQAEIDQMIAEAQADLMTYWEQPSSLSMDQAVDLLVAKAMGNEVSEEQLADVMRFMRDNDGDQEAQVALAKLWIPALITAKLQANPDAWQQGLWNTYSVPLTLVYLTGGLADSNLFPFPQDISIDGFWFQIAVQAGVYGGWPSYTIYIRIIIDLGLLASYDMHYTTDSIFLQFPTAIEIHFHIEIVCSWFFCFPIVYFHIHILNIVIANNAAYVWGTPFLAGAAATRPTDNDFMQAFVYDVIGGVNNQKPREFTSYRPLQGSAVDGPLNGSPTGGHPGVGDLLATAPIVNYVGLQGPPLPSQAGPLPPGAPSQVCPAPGAVPPQAAAIINQVCGDIGQIHYRARGGYGTAVPGGADALGTTEGITMYNIQAWQLNIAIVRTKGVDVPGSPVNVPGTFYMDAGCHIIAGCGNIWTVNYGVGQTVTQ